MNWSAVLVALVPPAVLTVTSTVPEPGGDVAVHEPPPQDTAVAGLVPNDTLPPDRFDPRQSLPCLRQLARPRG